MYINIGCTQLKTTNSFGAVYVTVALPSGSHIFYYLSTLIWFKLKRDLGKPEKKRIVAGPLSAGGEVNVRTLRRNNYFFKEN